MKTKTIIIMLAVMFVFAACEKPVIDDTTGKVDPTEANVIIKFHQYEQEAFSAGGTDIANTRAATDITNLCSRINLAVFDSEGTKVKTVTQKETDAGYGTVALSLAEGTYELVVIAHNGEGAATITSTDKVTFYNNKITDTFYYYGNLVVGAEKKNYDLELTRAVAMFRMVLTDENIPASVTKFKFYYLGGSSTFSPKDGYGCVASKQTEIRAVAANGVYEIYTMPHTEEDMLTKLTVTAQDANDNTVSERVFENIPIVRNQVTKYTGSFFGEGGSAGAVDGSLRMTANPDWDAVKGYGF